MILLYNPPSSEQRKPVVPLSLLAIGAVLEGRHDYRIIDGNLEPDPLAALDAAVRETGADVLGVTLMPGPQLRHAVPHCREIKARYPRLTVIWGGYFPTQHYDVCVRADYVDYVVRGHGEAVFAALVETIRSGGDPSSMQGVASRNRATGDIVSNPNAPIPHPQHLPDYPYARISLARYARRTFMGARTLPHHSSYGCPFVCNFCAVVNMVHGRWLAQSAERTASTVEGLVREHGADSVEFYDNNFFVDESRVAEFAGRIRNLGIGWWGEARIDTMLKFPDRTWTAMRDSGLRMVFLGAESGSDETLKRMDKGGTATAAKTLEIAAKMKAFGITPEFSFILGNPPDPARDIAETIAFIRKVKALNPASGIVMYTYTPVPLKGDLYDEAQASGFRFAETLEQWIDPQWQEFLQRRSAHTPWLSNEGRRQIRDFERVLHAYYPTITDPTLGELWRAALKAISAWRYRLEFYRYPLELRALHRLVAYQRPETTGF